MKKHLFLTGPAGCGKSAMIRDALGDRLLYAGGYMTEKQRDDQGRLLACVLFPTAAAGGAAGFERSLFLDLSGPVPNHDNEVFRETARRLLEEAPWYPFSVIDEFGGFELLVPQFRSALADFLSSDQPCIGVMKTEADAEALRRQLGLGERFTLYVRQLHSALKTDPDTLVVEAGGLGAHRARRLVRQWAAEYLK